MTQNQLPSTKLAEAEEEEMEASAAPLLDHLIELRGRLIKALLGFFIAFALCFTVKGYILGFLLIPYRWAVGFFGGDPTQLRLQSTGVLEAFLTQFKLAAFGGVVLAFPYIAFQLYRFIAPGLYRNERMAFLPFLCAAPVLFILGGAFVYGLIAPMIFWFGLSQQILPIDNADIERPYRCPNWILAVGTVVGFINAFLLGAGANLWGKGTLIMAIIALALIFPMFLYRHYIVDGGKFTQSMLEEMHVDETGTAGKAGWLPYGTLALGLLLVFGAQYYFHGIFL